jgi:squalene-hopene/tetraprenyl-beta-curcumene cyclase
MSTVSPSPLSHCRSHARRALDQIREELLAERNDHGHWVGELAPSALSTATAVSAAAAVCIDRQRRAERGEGGKDAAVPTESLRAMVAAGMNYLRAQQNDDGGFGDTDRSHSNIATSYLVLAASELARQIGGDPLGGPATDRLNAYLDRGGRLDGLRRRYGKDKTFVVPIMNNLAIAGLISWDDVAALPFEAAVFPQSMYRFLRMPVVSYAIPALVAIGQARHFLGKRAWLPVRLIRSFSIRRTLSVLARMQPASGGYLEATPLTAFVVMSLAATGRSDLSVARSGLRFLRESMLPDGNWPIDTNLATWVTSLAIHALSCDPGDDGRWVNESLIRWHLDCQHLQPHPFTGAEPGGWGWTDLSGAVPDSDDTPAAILAIRLMKRHAPQTLRADMDQAIARGTRWLLQLQNRNGGWPTFCRGWGKLPFDRSSTDLTAHAMRAIGHRADQQVASVEAAAIDRAMRKAARFLRTSQRPDGSWLPLWFGNQDLADESNPVYGTSKVLIAGAPDGQSEAAAIEALLSRQNGDGGWGGGASVLPKIRRLLDSNAAIAAADPTLPESLTSSVEETALAVEALATVILRLRDREHGREDSLPKPADGCSGATNQVTLGASPHTAAGNDALLAAILGGVDFLIRSIDQRRHRIAWPIGFYFAKLWYHERLYPLIFTAAALGKFLRAVAEDHRTDWPK